LVAQESGSHQDEISNDDEYLNIMFGATGKQGEDPKPSYAICGWAELQEQIKSDLAKLESIGLTQSQENQLLILRSFANLHLRGKGQISASLEIAKHWRDEGGMYFAH
jgi:hypothetical protein